MISGGSDNPQYDPQPINTSSVALNNDLNTIVQKFSEHYHDAWASRKIENGWVYGESWSDSQKSHPRLKPYNMLNDYVSINMFNLSFLYFYLIYHKLNLNLISIEG